MDGEGEDFFFLKWEGGAATAFPDTLCGVVVATGCNIIRWHVASIGGSVFNSPAGGMDVQPNEDGAVNRMPFWYECLGVEPGCVWKWTPWFWVWGRGGTVREVRKARQLFVWCCHSGRSTSLWWHVFVSGLRCGCCWGNHSCCSNRKHGCKILRKICGREVKQTVCDVTMGSLFPWFVQMRMSHFQHYRFCWGSTFVSTDHMEMMLMLPCFDYSLHWGLKKKPVDVMKPFQTHIWKKHEKDFVIVFIHIFVYV